MAGLMETLRNPPYDGRADLPALAAALQYEADELLPLGETLGLLGFAVLEEGDLILTETGRRFVEADTEERKKIFAEQLRAHVPLIAAIRQVIDQRPNHRASAVRFRDELEDHMSPEYAEETLRTVIAWGRYAEIFEYDEEAQQFGLEEEDERESLRKRQGEALLFVNKKWRKKFCLFWARALFQRLRPRVIKSFCAAFFTKSGPFFPFLTPRQRPINRLPSGGDGLGLVAGRRPALGAGQGARA